MESSPKIVALLGSYRSAGVIETVVDEILESARQQGAETAIIRLMDRHIEFCTNCRSCTQAPGNTRGVCPLPDEMSAILDEIAAADGFILASPMNFFTVTAVMKRFIERLVCFAYWPWGAKVPKNRKVPQDKRAVLVMSSAAPALLGRYFTKMAHLMKTVSRLLGAPRPDILWIGIAAQQPQPRISGRMLQKARGLGKKLATPR